MKKNKEHKKGESTIGKIIYGFLLFMPLFAIGVTCLTQIFVKNDSKINYKYESNIVNTENDIKVGNIYKFTIQEQPTITSNIEYRFFSAIYNFENYNFTIDTSSNGDLLIRMLTNGYFYITDGDFHVLTSQLISTLTFPLELDVVISSISNIDYTILSYTDFNVIDSVQETNNKDIFYYSVNKVTESPLFNWAQNSIIYTTMNATCTQLSITTPFIPLLMSYWLIISIIYFLYDIALILIWLLHDKIHELRDSLA